MVDQSLSWSGKSGKSYKYFVHELPWRPDKNQKGNYIFAKVENDFWKAVYVGQGDLRERYDAAINEGCVSDKGTTHYHVHLNSDSSARQKEEQDIVAGNQECLWPNGCNGHD